ncbi:ABC transporter ATP-binding protein [Anaerofilum sp. BX8]|uniref:ABC transporter ATP-binding protein n=1 Tax=Anaerofilum hominis TaxID=2763016 RepID=A0A923I9N6_9FIRM|nr:ABC transporter ATP-binding protein [Anaerofilum hominis]MBC5581381.1 ABC transporter ATP-binding protein [Anaerofilum hominis]
MDKPDYILQMKEIRKTFGPLVANDNISLNIERGTVHAIVGENGAGKSTLMNILTDIYKADSGDIILNGKKVVFKNSLDAARHGIGMIYQEFMLYPELSVYDNLILGFEEKKLGVFIDKKACKKKIEQICRDYSFDLPMKTLVKDLPVAILQQVEIVKALYRGADIIIMDEPTSVLTPQGIQGLFRAMRNLVSSGKTIIFISHKLKEVFEIADRITVMKDGKISGEVLPGEVTENQLASMMVGRDVILQANKVEVDFGEPVLSVKNLQVKDKDGVLRVKGVDLDVRRGEIVGLAGVAGSGQQQLVEALFGLRAPETGSAVYFEDTDITRATPRQRRCMGIGYVPQDRLGAGANGQSSIWETAIMGYHVAHGFKSRFLLNFRQIEEFTGRIVDNFAVKCQKTSDKIRSLSGGNIQKVVVGREFLQDNKLLIIEDPTRGIDVGAIEFIWKKIIDLAAGGVSVLLISHELNEVMQLADTIKVVYEGQLYDGGAHGELTEEEIGLIMMGGKSDEK